MGYYKLELLPEWHYDIEPRSERQFRRYHLRLHHQHLPSGNRFLCHLERPERRSDYGRQHNPWCHAQRWPGFQLGLRRRARSLLHCVLSRLSTESRYNIRQSDGLRSNLRPISAPNWTTSVNATVQPQCAYGVDTAANSIKVNYNAGVPATATYEGVNTTTEGNWTGAFGADGLIIANDATLPPSYASVSLAGENPYTWAASSSDVRALQTASGASTRIASTYYAAGNFTININLTDGNTHRIALYLLDWDSTARSETISIQDANTLATLSTEVFSGFHNGEYAIWDVSGSVLIRVTKKAGANAVVSGIFFN